MSLIKKVLFALSVCLFMILLSQQSIAGVMELSGSYGIRTSSIDEDNYTKNESWSASFAWYFLELSAIELSYTKGLAEQSLKSATDTDPTIYYADFEMYGADLVITLASKDSFLQPFLRGGMANIKKKFYKEEDGAVTPYGEPIDEVVPSYGAGLKLMLTKTFSIKASYDRWKSGSNQDKEIWDDAVKGGVSWYF